MSNLDTNRAIELIRQGNLAEGSKILAEVLQTSPDDEQAWLWMSACVPGQDRKIYCLQRVLQLNPDNQAARRGLEILWGHPASGSSGNPRTARGGTSGRKSRQRIKLP